MGGSDRKRAQNRGVELTGDFPLPEAPSKPIHVTVEEQRSQSVRPGADVTFICTAKSKVSRQGAVGEVRLRGSRTPHVPLTLMLPRSLQPTPWCGPARTTRSCPRVLWTSTAS